MNKTTVDEKKHSDAAAEMPQPADDPQTAAEKKQDAADKKNGSEETDSDETVEIRTPDDEVRTVSGEEADDDTLEMPANDADLIDDEAVVEDEDPVAARIRELQEQNLRLRAEFANYKRRVEREQLEFSRYIRGEMIKKLLPIYDDLKLMLNKASEKGSEESVLKGAKMIFEKFMQTLEKEGLTRHKVLGEPFDPQLHEALLMKPTDDESQHDHVVEVFQDGFTLNDRLLRPSKVVVGKYENDQS